MLIMNQTSLKFSPTKRFASISGLALTLFLASGCQMLTYTGPNGEHFTRSSFGANVAIASLSLAAGTNGVQHLELHGYQNDSTQALGVVTEAAVRAALQLK
jgi:hypothetical protein